MKKLLNIQPAAATTDLALLFLRIGIAALMLSHGIPKLLSLLSGNVQFPEVFGLSATASLAMAVFAELFCSVLILLGLGTRFAVLPLIVTMLVAVFMVHGDDPFAKKEAALLYLLPYVVLFITGSGRYSLDNRISRNSIGQTAPKQKAVWSTYVS